VSSPAYTPARPRQPVQPQRGATRLTRSLPSALAVAFALGAAGAGADTLGGHIVRTLFTVGFTVGSVAAVLLVRRELVWRTLWLLPLTYLALLVVGAVVSGGTGFMSWLALAYIFKAPAVLVGTVAAAIIAALRMSRGRSG